MADIAIIDYGMGNLRSVYQALRTVAPTASILVTGEPKEVQQAARVVFPGQGAMPDCIRELDVRGLRAAVLHAARSKPFLGICIGLQMLFEHSEEGDVAGLAILPGKVVRFAANLVDAQNNKLKSAAYGMESGASRRDAQQHPLWHGIAKIRVFISYTVISMSTGCAVGAGHQLLSAAFCLCRGAR